MTTEEAIDNATKFGQELEDIIVSNGSFKLGDAGSREKLVLALWSLILDYDKSILALMQYRFYGGAFALLRPTVEAMVRALVVSAGSEEDVNKIRQDKYRVNFETIGNELDAKLRLQGLLGGFLPEARNVLHSLTHSGRVQLDRRFNKNDLVAHYDSAEINGVIYTSGIAVFLVTYLVASQFNLRDQCLKCEEFLQKWAQKSQ